MTIVNNPKLPSLLILTIIKNILTTEEQTQLNRLKSAETSGLALSAEQKNKKNELENKKNKAISEEESYIDYVTTGFTTLVSKVTNFAKKVTNLEIIPIIIPENYTPLISQLNNANITKYTNGIVAKGEGQDTATFDFQYTLDGTLGVLLNSIYSIYLAPKVTRFDQVVKLTYIGSNGTIILNSIVVSTNPKPVSRNSNLVGFTVGVEIVRDGSVIGVPSSPYELLGVIQ